VDIETLARRWGGAADGAVRSVGAESIRCGVSRRGRAAGQGDGVVPRYPGGGVECHRGGTALQGHQIVEGFDLVQFRGMDHAHEEVSDLGAVEGAIEQ
jgi:hypothetical protein